MLTGALSPGTPGCGPARQRSQRLHGMHFDIVHRRAGKLGWFSKVDEPRWLGAAPGHSLSRVSGLSTPRKRPWMRHKKPQHSGSCPQGTYKAGQEEEWGAECPLPTAHTPVALKTMYKTW